MASEGVVVEEGALELGAGVGVAGSRRRGDAGRVRGVGVVRPAEAAVGRAEVVVRPDVVRPVARERGEAVGRLGVAPVRGVLLRDGEAREGVVGVVAEKVEQGGEAVHSARR